MGGKTSSYSLDTESSVKYSSNMAGKLIYFGLAVAIAGLAAALIYIIVDKTAYCRDPILPEHSAVSYSQDGGTVVCLPGFAFADGSLTNDISCSHPPNWKSDHIPKCIQVTHPPLAFKCPVKPTTQSALSGDIVFILQETSTRVEGNLVGLNSSTIQAVDITSHEDSCFFVEPNVSSDKPSVLMNQSFGFYARAIGAQRPMTTRSSNFDGQVVFVVEQYDRSIGVFTLDSESI